MTLVPFTRMIGEIGVSRSVEPLAGRFALALQRAVAAFQPLLCSRLPRLCNSHCVRSLGAAKDHRSRAFGLAKLIFPKCGAVADNKRHAVADGISRVPPLRMAA